MNEPMPALTTLLLAAFAIDRVASAVTFLFARPGVVRLEPEAAAREDWNRRLVYFFATAVLAVLSLATIAPLGDVLGHLGIGVEQPLKSVLTFILLVGGADRISAVVKTPGAVPSREPAPEPIEVRGTLRIDDSHVPPAGR